MATVNWIGGSGDWNTVTNWSDGVTNRLPGAGDDAVIDVAAVTVTHSSGTHTVQSLTINDPFTLSGGVLIVTGNLVQQNASTFTITGGTNTTLKSATVVGGGGAVLVATGGTLDGVTLGATVGGTPTAATVQGDSQFTVTGGLTMANGSLVDLGASMVLVGDQTLDGAGEIRFRAANSAIYSQSDQTTFGPGLTIHRSDTGSSDITVANGGSITNRGTIRADAGGQIRVFSNLGSASFVNAVGGVLAADGGTLSLATDWSNAGQITVNNSTLNLGGSFTTAEIGSITRTGGTINLTGLLDNTGSTLVLDATTGSWEMPNGSAELRGGNLVTSGGTVLVAGSDTLGTLNGVTLGGTVGGVPASATVLSSNSGGFRVTGGLTFVNGSLVDLGCAMFLDGDQTLGGDGEIRFRGALAGITNYQQTTFGAGLTIHRADAARSDINMVGGSITNQGMIRADAGGEIRVTGNAGTSLTNLVGGVMAADGGTLTLATDWSNAGQITVNNVATLNLGGSFTTEGLGSYTRTGGTINLTGLLDNTGNTLSLDAITGSWNLASGVAELRGGNLVTSGGASLFITNTNGTGKLNGVTLGGTIGGTPVSATVQGITSDAFTVTGGLTFTNDSFVDTFGGMILVGDQTLGGDGEIRVGSGISNFNQTTIGPGLTIHRAEAGAASIFLVGGSITNQGTILVDAGQLDMSGNAGTTFTNAAGGVLTAADGKFIINGLTVDSLQVTNYVAGTLTGGTWQALGNGTLQITGADITTNAATIVLDGVAARFNRDNTPTSALANLETNATAGSFTLRNGANLSTAGSFTNNGSLTLGLTSTLTVSGDYLSAGDTIVDGTLIASTVTVDDSGTLSGAGSVTGNVVNNGQVLPGTSPANLRINGDYTQGGTGRLDIEIGGITSGSQYDVLSITGSATLDGTLAVSLIDGFGPLIGQLFEIMTFANHNGAFSTVIGLSQRSLPLFDLAVNPANVELTSVANGTDLVFDAFQGTIPSGAVPGQVVSITYTVNNLSAPPAIGNWIDSVYLSRDGVLDPSDALLTRVEHVGDVAGLGGYIATATAPLPALADAAYRVIVVVDSRGLVSDADRVNNRGVSTETITVTVPLLTLGTPLSGTIAPAQELYYRVLIPPGTDVTLAADFAALPGAEVAVRYAALPDPTNYDEAVMAGQLHSRLLLSNTQGGTYYIRLHGRDDTAGDVAFTLTAAMSGFEITAVSPLRGSNLLVPSIITFRGAGFTPQTQVELRQAGGPTRTAQAVVFISANELVATVDLAGLPTGNFEIAATDASQTAVALDTFTVTNSDGGGTGAWISALAFVRVGASIKLKLGYYNTSENPLPAPLVQIHATDVYPGPEETTGGLGVDNIPGFLPGALSEEALHFNWEFDPFKTYSTHPTQPGTSTFDLSIIEPSQTPMDWDSQKATLRPDTIPPAIWDAVWNNLRPQLGETLSDFYQFLNITSLKLRESGDERVYAIDRLFSFELQRANNMPALPVPATAVDVAFPAPGLPLVFGRSLEETLTGRARLGRLGRGWIDNFDISISEDATTGAATLKQAGITRFFGRRPNGSYENVPGDVGVLSKVNGVFQLREATGELIGFRADGFLDFLQDANGNRIAAGYTGLQLTSLTHSSGAALTLAYNAQGRIGQVTDPAGGVATYEYDASGEHLIRVITTAGTTEYAYAPDVTGARAHTLVSIAFLDGTHLFFDYDSKGRLVRQQGDGGAETMRFAYDTASFTVTDANDQVTTFFYDDSFRIRKVRDPLGRLSYVGYDAANNPMNIGATGGGEANASYDAQGNPTLMLNPIGEALAFAYEPDHSRLVNFEDALGHATQFNHDANGNLLATTHTDGSVEQYAYDAQGNIVGTVNRLGQSIQYTYNSRGQVTRKDLPGGLHVDYTYSARANLETIVDASGTTQLEYLDPQNPDVVTKIIYPNGRFLEYTYQNGHRTRMVDQSSFAVNYEYDAVGRLDILRDGSDSVIVDYDYDPLGRLERETHGNLTVTTYAYDNAGQLVEISHLAPDASIQSQFVYAYDNLGRRTSVTTLEGVTTYGYDGAGRLTSVTLPGGRILTYAYDAAGNRTVAGDDGANTNYTVNELNQYTAFGSTSQSFDAAGNLTFSTSPGGNASYVYDAEGRLVSQTTPAGTWTYEYDALGNRIAGVLNGVRTEYLVDPFGLGDVVGEYDGAGALQAHYVHGLGLTSRVPGVGPAAFYQYDAGGNTTQVTGAGGAVLNSYGYLPFGESLTATESIANPFKFVGQFGVMREGSGIDYMRNRWYSPAQGRFTQADPIGLLGGSNSYAYVANNPVTLVDPSGLYPPAGGGYPGAGGPVWTPGNGLGGGGGVNYVNPLTGNGASGGGLGNAAGNGVKAVEQGISLGEKIGDLIYDARAALNNNWLSNLEEAVQLGRASTRAAAFIKGLRFRLYGILAVETLSILQSLQAGLIFAISGNELGCVPGIPASVQVCNPNINFFTGRHVQTVSVQRADRSRDPNDIVGPAGFGAQGFVPAQATLPYLIEFQNLPAAEGPAAEVVITEVLDADLDLDTFELDEFGFGDLEIPVPAGRQAYSTRIDLRSTRGVFVDFTAGLDRTTRTVTWRFTAIDPETLDLPISPFVGFLPPDVVAPEGQGFVGYHVRAKEGLTTGTEIRSVAMIVFDTNDPIATNQVDPNDPSQGTDPNKEALVTIDAVAPISTVSALPPESLGPTFTVEWSGTDDAGGSGIANYTIYVSDDGGPFVSWQESTTETQAEFTGLLGHSYAFYSIARDQVGNLEPPPAVPDTTTNVPLVPTTAQLSLSLVRTASSTDSLGQVTVLPTGAAWIDEWKPFFLEVWVRTSDPESEGVESITAGVTFNTAYFTAIDVEAGPAFAGNLLHTILEGAGQVNIAGTKSAIEPVGVGQFVLLARIAFQRTASDSGVTLDLGDGEPVKPVSDVWVELTDDVTTNVLLTGARLTALQVDGPPATELWPLMYDLNNDGRVEFGDFSVFASVFFQSVGGNPQVIEADFDLSGRVDFGDFSLFAANFFKTSANGDTIVYPPSFPDAWRQLAGLAASLTRSVALTSESCSCGSNTAGELAVAQQAAATQPLPDPQFGGQQVDSTSGDGSLSQASIGATLTGAIWFYIPAAESIGLNHNESEIDTDLPIEPGSPERVIAAALADWEQPWLQIDRFESNGHSSVDKYFADLAVKLEDVERFPFAGVIDELKTDNKHVR